MADSHNSERGNPSVGVVVVAYRTGPALLDCLRSIRADAPEAHLVVVDNGAAGSEIADAATEGAEIVGDGTNLGFAAGCNLGASSSPADVLVFLNPDTTVEPGAISALVRTVWEDCSIGSAMAVVLLPDGRINTSGNHIHLTGHGWSGGFGQLAPTDNQPSDVTYPSGAAMAMRAETFDDLGGFCEEYFLYHEDLELGWRILLAGMRNVLVPTAHVVHDYEFSRNATKFRYIERNRILFLLTCLPKGLLAAVAPLAIPLELMTLGLAAVQGWLGEKLFGYRWILAHPGWIMQRRRAVLHARHADDASLASALRAELDPAMPGAPGVPDAANKAMSLYWRLLGPVFGRSDQRP